MLSQVARQDLEELKKVWTENRANKIIKPSPESIIIGRLLEILVREAGGR